MEVVAELRQVHRVAGEGDGHRRAQLGRCRCGRRRWSAPGTGRGVLRARRIPRRRSARRSGPVRRRRPDRLRCGRHRCARPATYATRVGLLRFSQDHDRYRGADARRTRTRRLGRGGTAPRHVPPAHGRRRRRHRHRRVGRTEHPDHLRRLGRVLLRRPADALVQERHLHRHARHAVQRQPRRRPGLRLVRAGPHRVPHADAGRRHRPGQLDDRQHRRPQRHPGRHPDVLVLRALPSHRRRHRLQRGLDHHPGRLLVRRPGLPGLRPPAGRSVRHRHRHAAQDHHPRSPGHDLRLLPQGHRGLRERALLAQLDAAAADVGRPLAPGRPRHGARHPDRRPDARRVVLLLTCPPHSEDFRLFIKPDDCGAPPPSTTL